MKLESLGEIWSLAFDEKTRRAAGWPVFEVVSRRGPFFGLFFFCSF